MTCNCISKVEQLIKKKTNETGCLDVGIGVPSGIAMVNIYGMFHKQKKDGTFQAKWDKVNIFPEYCPFCGKKYVGDDKTFPMGEGGSLSEALTRKDKPSDG